MYKVFGEFAFFFLNKSAKNAQLFYFIATKMAIFNTHIKIETCTEEGSPVDKKNSTWRENWHTTYFYRIFVA